MSMCCRYPVRLLAVLMLLAGTMFFFSTPGHAATCTRSSTSLYDPNTGQSWSGVSTCPNDGGATMYMGANYSTPVAYLDSTNSWFLCYAYGEQHAGGNSVWYYTQGDRSIAPYQGRQAWGYVPAVNVWTTTDPGSSNLPQCAPDMWQVGLNTTDPNTGRSWSTVWYSSNAAGATLYKDANFTTPVGYLDSSTSWFTCYARGATHGGGNDVWYYTQGDRSMPAWSSRQGWGFIPAQNVYTRLDPYDGIPPCPFGSGGGGGGGGGGVGYPAPISCGSGCVAPPALDIVRSEMAARGIPLSGICPGYNDPDHKYGYHVPSNWLINDYNNGGDYSLQGTMNSPLCGTYASAIDIGMGWPQSRRWLLWLIREKREGRAPGVAEVIGSYDGVNARYWSDNDGWSDAGVYYDGDGHVTWSHVAIYRSTAFDDHKLLKGIPPAEGTALQSCTRGTMWNPPSWKTLEPSTFGNTDAVRLRDYRIGDLNNQRWNLEHVTYDEHTGDQFYRIVAANSSTRMCLDASAPNAGAAVYLYQCHSGSNQLWYTRGKQLRNFLGGKCLETTAASVDGISSKTSLRLAECRDEWDQSWALQCN